MLEQDALWLGQVAADEVLEGDGVCYDLPDVKLLHVAPLKSSYNFLSSTPLHPATDAVEQALAEADSGWLQAFDGLEEGFHVLILRKD